MAGLKPSTIDILYRDIQNLEAQFGGLAAQVERTQRLIKVDERAAKVEEQQGNAALTAALAANTEAVRSLIYHQSHSEEDSGAAFYRQSKYLRRKSAQERLEEIRMLSRCTQELTDVCSCGKHHGIKFVDEKGEVAAELCPEAWWVAQSRLAFEERRLNTFVDFKVYVGAYKL